MAELIDKERKKPVCVAQVPADISLELRNQSHSFPCQIVWPSRMRRDFYLESGSMQVVLISWKDSVSRLSIGSLLWLCKIGVGALPLLSHPPPDLPENSVMWNFIVVVLCY